MYELHEREPGEFYIRILYRNDSEPESDAEVLTIKGIKVTRKGQDKEQCDNWSLYIIGKKTVVNPVFSWRPQTGRNYLVNFPEQILWILQKENYEVGRGKQI